MKRIDINWVALVILALFMSMNFLPGWLQTTIIIVNILSFAICSITIIKISNLKHYNEQSNIITDFLKGNKMISVMSLVLFGFFFGLYDLYIFYKNPLRKDFDNIEQRDRDNKLKKLGI